MEPTAQLGGSLTVVASVNELRIDFSSKYFSMLIDLDFSQHWTEEKFIFGIDYS